MLHRKEGEVGGVGYTGAQNQAKSVKSMIELELPIFELPSL